MSGGLATRPARPSSDRKIFKDFLPNHDPRPEMEKSPLEKELQSGHTQNFRSEGERRIAYFLQDNQIKYSYEQGVLVNSPEGQQRIWYPDFYLPEFGAYIEYFGLAGRRNYDDGVKRKLKAYKEMGHEVISLYPWSFSEDWQGYVMSELRQVARKRYETLMTKPYWKNTRPTYGTPNRAANNYQSMRRRY